MSSPQQDMNNPVRWNGWGYRDTEFQLNPSGLVALTGSRYLFSGKQFSSLRSWMEQNAGLDINSQSPAQDFTKVPPPLQNKAFLTAIKGNCKEISLTDADRLFHGHGHTAQEIYTLRFGSFARVPDVVVYPGSHEDVVAIVQAAKTHDVVIIPYGGGTSVTQALMCPEDEKRCICSLDMRRMCEIKWINRESMLACVQAGIVGKDLEAKLDALGLSMGHEPDSMEFSTLGGWVATRASGMRKNKYGNIEDIVRHIKLVTAEGVLEKSVQVPRMSSGPDINQMILGSEGTLGVVTEVVIRVSELPKVTRYGSLIFPNFEAGVACLHEVSDARCAPVSIRLVDNMQFQFGIALKPDVRAPFLKEAIDKIKKWYVLNALKFDENRMVAATLLFEGASEAEVKDQEKKLYSIATKFGGVKGGEENGIRGYFLTYMIAYLRDFGMGYSFIAESFETSVPWSSVLNICNKVKQCIYDTAAEHGVTKKPFVSCRVTQTYDTGACVYFYFGFMWNGCKDPIAVFSHVEHAARECILALGGSLSHHHGIGKLRREFLPGTIGETGILALRGLKTALDPSNVFASGNLFDPRSPAKKLTAHL